MPSTAFERTIFTIKKQTLSSTISSRVSPTKGKLAERISRLFCAVVE